MAEQRVSLKAVSYLNEEGIKHAKRNYSLTKLTSYNFILQNGVKVICVFYFKYNLKEKGKTKIIYMVVYTFTKLYVRGVSI